MDSNYWLFMFLALYAAIGLKALNGGKKTIGIYACTTLVALIMAYIQWKFG